jgi:hypothetical protein
MSTIPTAARITLTFFAFAGTAAPLLAQSSSPQIAALGLVAKTEAAQIGSADALEGSSIYSGDYLSTSDKGALLVRVGALSLELQPSTGAHIYRAPYGAVVELNHGSVLYTTPGGQQNLVIVASDVRVTPSLINADFGRVSMDDPCDITVYSQTGEANVKVGSENRTVEQGKSYRVHAENELSFRKYVSPDADDYHRYHEHRPCVAAAIPQGHAPVMGGTSHFLPLVAGSAGVVTGIAIWKAAESPDRP